VTSLAGLINCHERGSGRPAAAIAAVLALVFSAYFWLHAAVPELPLHVH
jgi:hypothetical protein